MNIFTSLLISIFVVLFSMPNIAFASQVAPHDICLIEGEVVNVETVTKWSSGWGEDGSWLEKHEEFEATDVTLKLFKRSIYKDFGSNSCKDVSALGTFKVYQICETGINVSVGDFIKAQTRFSGDEYSVADCLSSIEVFQVYNKE